MAFLRLTFVWGPLADVEGAEPTNELALVVANLRPSVAVVRSHLPTELFLQVFGLVSEGKRHGLIHDLFVEELNLIDHLLALVQICAARQLFAE